MHVFALVRHLGVIFWPIPFPKFWHPINYQYSLILWPKYLSHLSTFPTLPTIEAIITISQLDNHNSLPNWSHYIQFFYTSVPQSGSHIPKSRQNDSLGCGRIMKVKVAQLCQTLCNPMENTGVGSLSLLQWISRTRNQTRVSCIAGGFFINWTIGEAQEDTKLLFILICLYKPIWKTTFY